MKKTPRWVELGINEYLTRMPHECSVKITTVASTKRVKNISILQVQQREENLLIKASSKNSYRIALDEKGVNWSTKILANNLKEWLQHRPTVNLYIGGPDGFTDDFRNQVDAVWSLSTLTLPHMLVRLVVVEQLYRAWDCYSRSPLSSRVDSALYIVQLMLNVPLNELVLASGSSRRWQLLDLLDVRYSTKVPNVDESLIKGEKPIQYVSRLARAKAQGIIELLGHNYSVLAADTTISLNDEVIWQAR